MNRETWLQAAIELFRSRFIAAGLPFPTTVHISIGFPSKGALARKNARIGECWKARVSADGFPHIFIHPSIAEGARALDIVIHELIHAALPEAGHKAPFARAMKQLGLEGKPTATVASDVLKAELQGLIERELGAYPHSALNPAKGDKVQTTRMLKVECNTSSCASDENKHYTARLSRFWLDTFGAPLCPNCKQPMKEKEAR